MKNNSSQYAGNDKKVDEAWERLQIKLAAEPVNDKWETWGMGSKKNDSKLAETISMPMGSSIAGKKSVQFTTEKKVPAKISHRRKSGARKWIAATAAAAIFGVAFATPMGNNAMAALLNQFRVQDITTVDSNELEQLFNQIDPNKSIDNNNKFGQFTSKTGSIGGDLVVNRQLPDWAIRFCLPS